jgi:ribosome-binding protein aMBF1 (putative translation factor)
MSHQDWEQITIRNPKAATQGRKVELVTGETRGKTHTITPAIVSELRKVENAVAGKSKMLTPQSRTAMAAARVAKGLTQKQLDQQGAFPLNSTNMWEAGKICPTSQQIQVLHRILQVKLERA